jgi:putative transposase
LIWLPAVEIGVATTDANRPHTSHSQLTPAEFALQWATTHQPQVA